MARERVFSKLLGRGRRTGVQVYASQEPQPAGMMEDLDTAFGTATSPPKDKENNTMQLESSNNNHKPRKELRFSLGTTASSDDSSLVSATQLQGVIGKLKRRSSRGSLSPSELSKVSTAPPSPKEQVRRQDENDDEESMQARLAKASSPNPPVAVMDDNDEDDLLLPPAPADDDEEEDDLTPPPDSPEALSLGQEEEVPTQGPDDHELEQHDEIPTQGADDLSDDDDDDKEGAGFAMATSPEQPPLLQSPDTEEEEEEETPVIKSQSKRKKLKSARKSPASVQTKATRRKTKTKKRHAVFSPKGIPAGPRTFTAIPVTDTDTPPPGGPRRSRRTRVRPLEWWRNERPEYGPNTIYEPEVLETLGIAHMPVVKSYQKGDPTPYKKRKAVDTTHLKKKKSKSVDVQDKPFDDSQLRKKYPFQDGSHAYVWDDVCDKPDDLAIVGYMDQMEPRDLPITLPRKKGESKVTGRAAQAFNVSTEANPYYPGYIMGNLTLPPTGIKCAESVGSCAQTFTVVFGQPNALEVAFGDPDHDEGALVTDQNAQRFLLSPGDVFRVPPGNCYRIHNHSKQHESFLTWTIIRANASSLYTEEDDGSASR